MAGRAKRVLAAGLASLFAVSAVIGYAGCTEARAAEARTERGGIILSQGECEIYDILYDKIVKTASNGGSTSDMLGGRKMTLSWSYEELGLNGATDISCSTEAVKALRTSLNRVRDALIAECPYELYWFDKTTGYSYSYRNPERGRNTVSIEITKIKFAVSEPYQLGGDVNKVSSVKAVTANRAVAYAQQIVEKYRGVSDYEKLSGYKNEICSLADYDDTITEDSVVSYGDEWQIIYVFDCKPETKVVCEAYAKAFQYLCDQTDFDSPVIDCCTVSGTMNGIVHMWNIVTMPDGGNYIVDPTNCDEGTLSALTGGIFLAGGEGNIVNGYRVMGYPYCYDQNIIENFGIGSSVLSISAVSYAGGTVSEGKTPVTEGTSSGNVPASTITHGNETQAGEVNGNIDAAEEQTSAAGDSGAQENAAGQKTPDTDKDAAENNTPKFAASAKTQSSTTSASSLKISRSPNTGDTSVITIWGTMLALAGGAGVTVFSRRRSGAGRD